MEIVVKFLPHITSILVAIIAYLGVLLNKKKNESASALDIANVSKVQAETDHIKKNMSETALDDADKITQGYRDLITTQNNQFADLRRQIADIKEDTECRIAELHDTIKVITEEREKALEQNKILTKRSHRQERIIAWLITQFKLQNKKIFGDDYDEAIDDKAIKELETHIIIGDY